MQAPEESTFSSSLETLCDDEKTTFTAPVPLIIDEAHHEINQKIYQLSTEAEPFIPSFMRGVGTSTYPIEVYNKGHDDNTQLMTIDSKCAISCHNTPPLHLQKDSKPQPNPTLDHDSPQNAKKSNSHKLQGPGYFSTDQTRKEHFDLWVSQLINMSEDEVHMLMDCLPEDIQHLYFHNLSHFVDTKPQGGISSEDKQSFGPKGCTSMSPAVSAAFATFNKISEERLQHIEQLLCLETLNDYVCDTGMREESLFVNPDEGLNSDEEEWLLEQIMSVDLIPPDSELTKPDQNQYEKRHKSTFRPVNIKPRGRNKRKQTKRRGEF
ncbi:unnamed protein product [Phytomonas sp. Hart1]|nr:unnamed protein product [Phytomonas sp. Hart1]|eukprot:CCW69491.1 unnamed protein product [Phytomonas sp. isolate Hart1]